MQKKLVIVDDDYGVQDIAKIIFEKAGYLTVVLCSAHPLYENEHADASLILLDRHLSGMDGLEVCKDLKQQAAFANTPILLMSATSHEPLNLAESYADGFVEKPFRKKDLLERIDELMMQPAKQDAVSTGSPDTGSV